MKFKLTRLGKTFAGIALFFYLAAMSSQSMLLLALIGVVAGLMMVNLGTARRMLQSLELRAPAKALIPEGGKIDAPWQVLNKGKTVAQWISVHSSNERLFTIDELPPADEAFVVPEHRLLKRGVYPHQEVHLATIFPFGLVMATRQLPLAGEVLVYPALYETKAPAAAGYEAMTGGKFKGNRRSPFGSNFAGVRPWVTGDPVKQVHWKSSAKGRGLMVKTFDEELSGKISLLISLDGNASPEITDNALRAAGSLMFAALDEGHQLEWAFCHEGNLRKVAPFSDGGEILEALARAARPADNTASLAFDNLERQLTRRSGIAVVATGIQPTLIDFVGRLQAQGRKICWYLPTDLEVSFANDAEMFRFGAHQVSSASAERAWASEVEVPG